MFVKLAGFVPKFTTELASLLVVQVIEAEVAAGTAVSAEMTGGVVSIATKLNGVAGGAGVVVELLEPSVEITR